MGKFLSIFLISLSVCVMKIGFLFVYDFLTAGNCVSFLSRFSMRSKCVVAHFIATDIGIDAALLIYTERNDENKATKTSLQKSSIRPAPTFDYCAGITIRYARMNAHEPE